MKVLVTGATGFIGEKLARKLLSEGYEVNSLYRSKKKVEELNMPDVNWFRGDILDPESIDIAIKGCDAVFHVAALAVAWEQQPGDFRKYNVQGTINILKAALVHGVKRVVFTSTAGVFGPSLNGTITEESVSPLPHFTGYERSKAEIEHLILNDYVKHKGQDIVIVNPTRVFGPGPLNQSNSTTLMIKKYLEGKWHILPGDGNTIGNYAFVDDVVRGHILALQKGRKGERYILGGENISYRKFFETIDNITKKHHKLFPLPLMPMLLVANSFLFLNRIYKKFTPPITPAHVRKFSYNWEVSSHKAISELGYYITPFNEAMRKTILSFKN